MARRSGPPTYGKRYLGNTNNKEVHDLDNEKTAGNHCQIDEIIRGGNAVTFNPDTYAFAKSKGYDNCAYCIGLSQR